MKSIAATVIALSLAAVAAGQSANYSPRADKWGISEASVRAHMEFLASDALNGRGSGTRDEWIAAEYIASQLRRWGLEPLGDDGGFVKKVTVERSEITTPPVLSFAGRTATDGEDVTVTSIAAPSLSGPLQQYRPGVPVRPGAVLLLPAADPPGTGVTEPAAMLVTLESDAARTRRERGERRSRPLAIQWIVGTPRRAAVSVNSDIYQALLALPDGTDVALRAEAVSAEPRHTWNVVAKLSGRPGPGASEAIVLSAHLDHIGDRAPANAKPGADTINNGADDDASGTTAVLEIAQALAAERTTRRTVIFAWFGSEEGGGLGSRHFIDQPPVPLDRIVANLQFEMIGRPDAKVAAETLWLTGYERSNLGSELATRGARLVADPHPEQSFFTRSDNIRFARRGIVAHTVSSFGLHTDYHRPSDEVETIDFVHMTTAIRSMVQPIVWLANATFRPEWNEGASPARRP